MFGFDFLNVSFTVFSGQLNKNKHHGTLPQRDDLKPLRKKSEGPASFSSVR
jgi:hypothetical protein